MIIWRNMYQFVYYILLSLCVTWKLTHFLYPSNLPVLWGFQPLELKTIYYSQKVSVKALCQGSKYASAINGKSLKSACFHKDYFLKRRWVFADGHFFCETLSHHNLFEFPGNQAEATILVEIVEQNREIQ